MKTDFVQIGAEGGFLPAPAVLRQLLIGPAEKADVVVDLSRFKPGDTLHMLNVGPDEPFGGPFPASVQADANTTGQVAGSLWVRVLRMITLGQGSQSRARASRLPRVTRAAASRW